MTLYYGGNILTMDNTLYADAILVDGGKIVSLGSRESLRKEAKDCEEINLNGATLMPGFIDPHSHFFQMATSLLQVSLDGVTEIPQMRERVQNFIKDNHIAPGQWVNGKNYDNNIMPGYKNPTIEELDTFAPQNPMVICFKSGHMGLFNSAALKELGITPDTPSGEGGRIEVVDGKLTGYIEENTFIAYLKKIPMPSAGQLKQAFISAQQKYASYGITTVQDGMVVSQMFPMYEMLLNQDLLQLDVRLYSSTEDYEKTNAMLKKYPNNKRLRSSGMKIFLDGSPQGRTAWTRKPYAGEEEYCAYGTMTDQAVKEAFQLAAQENTQLLAHCNGDGAAAQFLRCLQKAEETYPILESLHPVIIHGQLMGTDQIPLAKKLGAYISFFVAHVYHWGDVHIRNFGMERASKISPAATAMQAGINVTFHQDAPVIEPDMMETVWCAVNRVTKDGVKLAESERVTTLDALRAITVNGAVQYGEDRERGKLAPGLVADFAILDRNPLETAPEELRSIKVLATIKEGKYIYRA